MKGKLLAAALATITAMTTALAAPAFAQPAGNAAAPAETPPPAGPPGPGAMHRGAEVIIRQGMPGRMRHEWRHGMHERQAMRWRNPKERCIDRLARRAGRLAYIGTKLELTAVQRPLWDKLEKAAETEAQNERQLCDSLKPAGAQSVLDRVGHMEQFLKVRLAGIEAAKPDLEALYKALTPAQRAIFDHPYRQR